MTMNRPNPELLLAAVHNEERRQQRGKLKIFLGMAAGVGKTFARLRAERDGGGDGRVYHIDFTAVNGNRTLCTGTVIVGVPHDQAIPAGDGGPRYDSTIPSDVKGAGYGDVPSHPVYLPVIR